MEQILTTDEIQAEPPAVLEALPLDERIEIPPAPPEGLDTALYDHDDPAARRQLRTQIARLEGALGRVLGSAFPRTGIDVRVAAAGGPRMLTLSELERTRDALAAKLKSATETLDQRTGEEAEFRGLIEEMSDDPASHKWIRVSNEDIGEPGCRHWHSRPRWGLLGMLLGWWRVKVSSGCPLARGRGLAAPRDADRWAARPESAAASSGAHAPSPAARARPPRAPGARRSRMRPSAPPRPSGGAAAATASRGCPTRHGAASR